MKTLVPKPICFVVALLAATAASAQNYSIDWHAIDGGGGTSTGGVYSVSGGFGESSPCKRPAPLLSIARTTTNTVAVSWPSPSAGFNLQVNTNGVASANWSNVVTAPPDNGTTRTVVVNPPTGNRFYRLFKP